MDEKKTEYIKGSTVVAPGRVEKGPKTREEYEVLRKSQVERSNRLKHKRNLKKRRVLSAIAVLFTIGFALMLNESKLYDKQQKITNINRQISEVNRNNEDLKLQLIKLNGLNNIKDTAENKLQMSIPERGKEIYVDFSKNNFADVPRDDKESLANDFLAKIKSLLF